MSCTTPVLLSIQEFSIRGNILIDIVQPLDVVAIIKCTETIGKWTTTYTKTIVTQKLKEFVMTSKQDWKLH